MANYREKGTYKESPENFVEVFLQQIDYPTDEKGTDGNVNIFTGKRVVLLKKYR